MDTVEFALACYRTPLAYQDRLSLAAPLPEGMDRLLWLANGSPETLDAATRQTGAKSEELREAARFLVQQLCFARGASPYRVLGLQPEATLEQIKEHHRLLMRLFHPDRGASRTTWTDHYASRVNEAWTALSRPQSRLNDDHRPRRSPEQALIPPTARPPAAGLSPGRSERQRKHKGHSPWARFAAPRRGLPVLVLGGFVLAAVLVVGGIHLFGPPAAPTGFPPTAPVDSEPPVAMPDPATAEPADHSAIPTFLAAPDWRALEQREQQAQRQVAQAQEARKPSEESRQQQIAAEEALLEKMRAERAQLEEQVKIEQARMERARAERLAVEQQRLARLRVEQARVEQVGTGRELVERRRLEALQAVQAKAEHFAEELRIERQRLEQLKAEQAKAEQIKEQAKMERAQAERQRPEEQLQAERVRLEAVANRAPAAPVAVAVAAPERRDLTTGELKSLMSRYTRAYRRGDLNGVMALFATGARSRTQEDYATLFATYHIRGLWLRDLRWFYRGGSASGSGRYELRLQRRDNGESRQVGGSIRFTVQKSDHQVLIEAIEYDWPKG